MSRKVTILCFSSWTPPEVEGEQAGSCFGASIGLGIPLSSYVDMNLRVGPNWCTKKGKYKEGETTKFHWQRIPEILVIPFVWNWI